VYLQKLIASSNGMIFRSQTRVLYAPIWKFNLTWRNDSIELLVGARTTPYTDIVVDGHSTVADSVPPFHVVHVPPGIEWIALKQAGRLTVVLFPSKGDVDVKEEFYYHGQLMASATILDEAIRTAEENFRKFIRWIGFNMDLWADAPFYGSPKLEKETYNLARIILGSLQRLIRSREADIDFISGLPPELPAGLHNYDPRVN